MIDVRFAALARRDLENTHILYAKRDPGLGTTIIGRILAATRRLGETPRAGPAAAAGNHRRWLVPKTPYVLIYRIERDHVRIVRVLHTARQIASP